MKPPSASSPRTKRPVLAGRSPANNRLHAALLPVHDPNKNDASLVLRFLLTFCLLAFSVGTVVIYLTLSADEEHLLRGSGRSIEPNKLLHYSTLAVREEQGHHSLRGPADESTVEEETAVAPLQQQVQQETGSRKRIESVDELQHTFPLMVHADEMQTISHPGLEEVMAGDPKRKRALPYLHPGASLTMTVPKFFDDSYAYVYQNDPAVWSGTNRTASHNDNEAFTVRDTLGDYGQRLMMPQEAARIGSFDENGHETIYCSVASYRDPECTDTVEDLYDRAEHPERIRVAVIEQRVDGDSVCNEPKVPCSQDPEQALCKYRHLIEVFEMDAIQAIGPVFARHMGHRMYRGEYFAMQIDSHVRFVNNWDTDIIGQWRSTNNEMGIMSTYLADIQGNYDYETHERANDLRPLMCKTQYEDVGERRHLRHGQQPLVVPEVKGQPSLHPFWAAGFSFARGHFVLQVPYDQYLPMVFQGEEINMGIRGFSYGYDYYAPDHGVCFHIYAIKENEARRKNIPKFWEHSQLYEGVMKKAMKRLNSIIGVREYPRSEWKTDEEKRYGLGQVRKPEKFYKVYGIHTDTEEVEDHLCHFVGKKKMMDIFLPALRKNKMGLDYDKIDYEFVDPEPEDKDAKSKK